MPTESLAALKALPRRLSERFWGAGRGRPGVLAVFRGPTGSGKTLAVKAVATELQLPVFEADLGRLAAGGTGHANRSLGHLFVAAQQAGAVVELDGAEVLANDTRSYRAEPAGISLDELLRRCEAYPGLVVVACRFAYGPIERIAEAADVVLEFGVPDAVARVELWRRHLPEGAQVGDGEIALLADGFPVSAGVIAAACAAAAQHAEDEGTPLVLAHLTAALRRSQRVDREVSAGAEPAVAPTAYRPREPAERPPVERPPLAPIPPQPVEPITARVPEPLVSPPARPAVPEPPRVRTPEPPRERTREPAPEPVRTPAPPLVRSPEPPREPTPEPVRTPEPEPLRAPEPAVAARRETPRTLRRAFPAWLLITALAGGVAAVALGFAFAHGKSPKPSAPLILDRQVLTGPLRFSYPSTWAVQATPSLPGLTLTNALTVGSATRPRGQLVVGTVTNSAAGLPAAFTSTLSGQPEPDLVSLGSQHFYRLLDSGLTGGGGGEAAYVLSSGGRTVVAVCRAQVQAFAGLCERVLSTLSVTPLQTTTPVLSPTYVTGLNTILSGLSASRRHDLASLASARTAAAQAKAALALADLHRKAANAVWKLPAGNASSANNTLGNALMHLTNGYADLAHAAGSSNARAYARAQTEITQANLSVSAALVALKKLGYQVTS